MIQLWPHAFDRIRTRDQADVTSRQNDLFLVFRTDPLDQGLSALRRNDMIVLRHYVQQRYLDVLQVDRLAADLKRALKEAVLLHQLLDRLPEVFAGERQG